MVKDYPSLSEWFPKIGLPPLTHSSSISIFYRCDSGILPFSKTIQLWGTPMAMETQLNDLRLPWLPCCADWQAIKAISESFPQPAMPPPLQLGCELSGTSQQVLRDLEQQKKCCFVLVRKRFLSLPKQNIYIYTHTYAYVYIHTCMIGISEIGIDPLP